MAFAPQGCDLETLVGVAGRRWHIEHAFEAAKQETGPGRLRGAQRARLVPERDPGPAGSHAGGLPPVARPGRGLSLPEIRHLLWRLVLRVPRGVQRVLAWSH